MYPMRGMKSGAKQFLFRFAVSFFDSLDVIIKSDFILFRLFHGIIPFFSSPLYTKAQRGRCQKTVTGLPFFLDLQ